MTTTYSLTHSHFQDFDRLFNALPDQAGKSPTQIAALWETYMPALYTSITTRAHTWVLSKAESLRTRDYGLLSSLPSDPPTGLNTVYQSEIMNRTHISGDLVARADCTVFMHLPFSDPPSSSRLPLDEQRCQQYAQSVFILPRQRCEYETSVSSGEAENCSARLLNIIRCEREAQDETRLDLRKRPVNLPPVGWIANQREKLPGYERGVDSFYGS